MKTKVLMVVAGTTNRLLDVLIEEIKKKNWCVRRIQQQPVNQGGRIGVWARHIAGAVMDFLATVRAKPEIVAFHFYTVRSFITSLLLMVLRQEYVIHFWGSDYFYWRNRNNCLLRLTLRRAKCVTFANSQMLVEAKSIFGENIRFRVLRFGLEVLDIIDSIRGAGRNTSGLINVVVGTNSQPNQQHFIMIDELEKLADDVLRKCLFIFPLNYGDRGNRVKVIERLSGVCFNFEILDDYITGERLANFRLNTDVLIQVQKTDAMSAAMLETLYAGGKVITGKWLPYDDLRRIGIDWTEVETLNELAPAISLAIQRDLDAGKNKEIVSSMARWRNLIPAWDDCYAISVVITSG